MEPAEGLVVGVVIREDKELIDIAIVVVVEGVSTATSLKDVFSNSATKDAVPLAKLSRKESIATSTQFNFFNVPR